VTAWTEAPSTAPARGPRFVLRCIRGVEWIVGGEVEGRGLGRVERVGHREVQFSTIEIPSSESLRLRTADDVLLVCADLAGFDHTRASLERLTEAARALGLRRFLALRDRILGTPGPRALTVVASFLGRRNYNRYEIEAAVALGVQSDVSLPYRAARDVSGEEPVVTLRVHLVDDRALFALRVFRQPLHRRDYRTRTHPGALHPPLAAALCLVAGLRPGARLLDPFCGTGTIAIEACRLEPGAIATASDVSHQQLAAARDNFRTARLAARVFRSDAARLPIEPRTFDRIVSNPPWGLAVLRVGSPDGSLVAGAGTELARVLGPDGRAVLLVEGERADPSALFRAGMSMRFRSRISLFGQHPEIWVLAFPDGAAASPLDGGGQFGAELIRASRLAETLPT
jgi:tRNA (guanine6-N2)-methyltransferase